MQASGPINTTVRLQMQEWYYHVVIQIYSTNKNSPFSILLLTASQPTHFPKFYGHTEAQTAESVKDMGIKYTHLSWTEP